MRRVAVLIGLLGVLALGSLPASAQERALDCAGVDRDSPNCAHTRPTVRPHGNTWRNGTPPRTIAGERPTVTEPSGGSGPADGGVFASRTFVGPNQYPPEQFAAYGIVAFPGLATEASRDRYLLVCREYWSALTAASELDVPLDQQMVTVWPVRTIETAEYLSLPEAEQNCNQAVDEYDLRTAQIALRHAEIADGQRRTRRGPYLLAWAPPTEKGKPGALVLSIDLSSANAPEHFADAFQLWRRNIETRPELWQRGWSVDEVRDAIRNWVDQLGFQIATLAAK